MQQVHDTNTKLVQVQPKKYYITPALVRYGNIRNLTQSGGVSKNENQGHPDGKL